MITESCEVGIIGASLAGSALALRLGRRGVSTALVDRELFPRDKVCGEGLSIIGMRELVDLGFSPETLGAHPFFGFDFCEGEECSRLLVGDEGAPLAHGYGVERLKVDALLADRARTERTCLALFGEKPVIAPHLGGGFLIRTSSHLVRARYLVFATGGHSVIDQELGVSTRDRGRGRVGMRIHVRASSQPLPMSMVTVTLDRGIQLFCTPLGERRFNISAVAHESHARKLRFAEIERLVPRIGERLGLDFTVDGSPLGTGTIGRFERRSRHPRVFLLGDTKQQLDPTGGMGMSHALVGARLLADSLADLTLRTRREEHHAARAWNSRMQRDLSPFGAYTKLSYLSLAGHLKSPLFRALRTGTLARELMLSMHRPPSRNSPAGMLAWILLSTAGAI